MTDPHGRASFATTRWTLILAAVGSPDAPTSRAALTELCRTYWQPLYAHARRHPLSPADAEDAVQGFFARLLRLESLATVDRERGRFRSFLLGSFNHYLADLRDHARAEKRGAHLLAPLDAQAAEAAFTQTPAPDLPPDRAFDQAWALALLTTVTTRLRDEHLAAKLGLSEPALRVTLHRLRQRYRQLLRAEIAHTVAHESDIDDELHILLSALSG